MEFKDNVKKLRKEYELSQEELSIRIGVARSSVANYENGQNFPSTDIILKLSEVFNCSVDYLLGKTNERNSNVQYDPNAKVYLRVVILERVLLYVFFNFSQYYSWTFDRF